LYRLWDDAKRMERNLRCRAAHCSRVIVSLTPPGVSPTVKSSMLSSTLELEAKIAAIVHRLLRDRSVDREFGFQDNLRDAGLTSLDMTSLVFAVEADFVIEIPDRAITPTNFTSVTSIAELVRTLWPRAAASTDRCHAASSPAPSAAPQSSEL
jgi:acyl carrier protein